MMDTSEAAAVHRREAALMPRCGCTSEWSVVTRDGIRRGVCAKCGATTRDDQLSASTGIQSPAAMLGEALELMERARVMALDAFDRMPNTMLSRVNGVVRFSDARQWVTWLRREAEARESKP